MGLEEIKEANRDPEKWYQRDVSDGQKKSTPKVKISLDKMNIVWYNTHIESLLKNSMRSGVIYLLIV